MELTGGTTFTHFRTVANFIHVLDNCFFRYL